MSNGPSLDKPTADSASPLDLTTHYVDPHPFDPQAEEPSAGGAAAGLSTRRLMWLKFRRHGLARFSLYVLGFFYLLAIFAEFIAPYPPDKKFDEYRLSPPTPVSYYHEGEFVGPFTYAQVEEFDMETMALTITQDTSTPHPVRFFCRGEPYKVWGLAQGDIHLFCPGEAPLFLFGSDGLGRDVFSRIVYGARVSLTVGLIGVAISLVLGILLGGLAGYFGGWIDAVVQRVIEVLRSLPELPLWMALSAAIPVLWPAWATFLGITVIFGLLDWTGLARAVRSKLLSLREEEFALAAKLTGASSGRIIYRHLVPNFASHLIANATLAIPAMILGETALSFLGLGIKEPLVSWGLLLNDAQDLSVITITPWLLLPAVPVVVVVLAFNFLGDGMRDAADPYK